MVFHWSLSDSKSPKVSRTLLSILVNLDNAVVWMVSTCPLISKSFSPFTNPLRIVLRAPITFGVTITFLLHRFFLVLSQGQDIYLYFHFFKILLRGLLRQQSPLFSRLYFLLIITRSGHLAKIRWPVWISKSPQNLCARFWVVHIPLIHIVKFKLLTQFSGVLLLL